MSYDPTTPGARKGKLGEQIVKKLIERFGCTVEKPDGVDEDAPTAIDWLAWSNGGLTCVEVKTVKKFMYSHIPIPTFKIPLAKYECYKREAQERGGELELYFVSSEDGRIYAANARVLDEGYREGGFEFPVTVAFKDGDPDICFCLDQFTYKWSIDPEDIAALRAIDAEFQSSSVSVVNGPPQEENAQALAFEPAQASRCFIAPNGTEMEFCPFERDMYVWTRKFKAALGYSNSWDEKGFVEQAAQKAGVEPLNNQLCARDIPKILDAFIQKTSTAKIGTSKHSRSENARELNAWFKTTVMPALYPDCDRVCKPDDCNCEPAEMPTIEYSEGVSKFICEEPVSEPVLSAVDQAPAFERAREESLSSLIDRLAQAIGIPVAQILEAVRQLKLRQDPVLKELFGL